MSGGRRKSRKPQKYEDTNEMEEYWNDASMIEKSNEQDAINDQRKRDCVDKCESVKLSNHFVRTQQNASGHSSTSKKVDDEVAKDSDAEITTSGILGGHRQSFISECKVCCIQLQDWKKTYAHLLHHRVNNLPQCYNKNRKDVAISLRFDCLLCNYTGRGSHRQLILHSQLEHSASNECMHCSFCAVQFKSLREVYQHMDVKCIDMKCPICSMISNQEYDFYMHLSGCLGTFHPNITSLKCHICNKSIGFEDLANHMINHSILDSTKVDEAEDLSQSTPPRSFKIAIPDSEVFLCDVCDSQFHNEKLFAKHRVELHIETKYICHLCYMRGFCSSYLLVRHMILRCTERSIRQLKFGKELMNFGKVHRKGFLSTLKTKEGKNILTQGLRAWRSHLMIKQFLDAFCSASHEELRNFHTESKSDEFPTDLELISFTTDYELNKCKNQLFLNRKKHVDPKVIPQLYSGVTLLPNVDISRLKKVYAEAMKEVPHFIRDNSFSNSKKLHLERRLEMEAQYLREIEPFYIKQKFSDDSDLVGDFKIEEERYHRLISEANKLKKDKNFKSKNTLSNYEVKQEDIERLKKDAFNLMR